jgi:hypothetical protein
MRRLTCAIVSCLVVASCTHDRTYPPRTFTWSGDVPAGGSVKVRNIDGAIAVIPSTNKQLSVSAVIMNAAPSAVQVKPAINGSEIEFCTLLGAQTSGTCGDTAGHKHTTTFSPFSLFSRRHRITVLYTLHVPPGVRLDVGTVNGRIAAQDVGGDVNASTVNGDVVISTTVGTVNAETVNGSIIASMAALPDSGNVHLETVNGSITSVLPPGIAGMLDLETVNGRITAHYPHTAPDSVDPHHLHVELAPGPRRVHLETVNGAVSITQYTKPASVTLVH